MLGTYSCAVSIVYCSLNKLSALAMDQHLGDQDEEMRNASGPNMPIATPTETTSSDQAMEQTSDPLVVEARSKDVPSESSSTSSTISPTVSIAVGAFFDRSK